MADLGAVDGFRRLAIAERGGAAMRCLAAVADINAQLEGADRITTIALYGDADAAAWFVRAADEAAPLGVDSAVDADVDTLMTALAAAGADAVWVGWGPLACRRDLVDSCAAAGVVVVGPGQVDCAALSDGGRALADRLGIPTAATSAEPWRQVDVQVAADGQVVWSLGVRDASLQRKHEPVIIESGSTALDGVQRATVEEVAVRIAGALRFAGLGTVEFWIDADTRQPAFRAFHPCLRAGHPVTEATTGLDLVALQLTLARGGRLSDPAPVPTGHAIEVRLLAADPERDFAPAGGRLSFLRLPVGTGVRVDLGLTEGDVVDAAANPLFATVVATGRDRGEAHARLQRALHQLIAVIDGGTTTKAVVLHEIDAPAIRSGEYDCRWLDGIVEAEDHLPPPDPLALLVAAVEAYGLDETVDRDALLSSAARGRPTLPDATGHRVELRLRGRGYRLHVYRTGRDDYRIDDSGTFVDVRVLRLSRYERALSCAGRSHRVVVDVQPARMHVEVDGVPHLVARDDGVVVRSQLPAFVVDVRAHVGDRVRAGDPLVVLESMKMATTVAAPVDGVVAALLTGVHTQVEVGAPLVRLRPVEPPSADRHVDGAVVDLTALAVGRDVDASAAQVQARLRAHLLGYDLDPAAVRRLREAQHAAALTVSPNDPQLVAHELDLVEIFTDLCALSRRDPDPADAADDRAASAQEYLFTFLAHLDPEAGDVPATFLARLRAALARYGVTSLSRSPELESALLRMYRSFLHARDLSWMVTEVLDRWLQHRTVLAPSFADRHRAALTRLVHVMPGRSDAVAELAREVHYRYVDQPLLESAGSAADASVGEWLGELLSEHTDEARAATLIEQLVWCPRPLRARIRDAYRVAPDATRHRVLETRLRRFYRIRELTNVGRVSVGAVPASVADYAFGDERAHVVSAYCAFDEVPAFVGALGAHLATVPGDTGVFVDLETWRDKPGQDIADLAADVGQLLDGVNAGRQLSRVDVTVTTRGPEEEHQRTQHVSFRPYDGRLVEDLAHRNLHPLIADRLELELWSGFTLDRLRSAEDVYLFRATAKENPADSRFVALAEVRDLTPAHDSTGRITGYPLLERMLSEAFTSMRHAAADQPPRERPMHNRVVLHVRPPWDVSPDVFREIAHRWAPVSNGLGLEKVQLQVRLREPGADGRAATIDVTGLAEHGVTIRQRDPDSAPVQPLTDYEQRLLKAERAGAPYPYELLRTLTPPTDAPSDFPPSRFDEFDLADEGVTLVAVDRVPGGNTCGLVAGVLTSYTRTVPEGMSRVVLLGDPTRGLGNLAEAECRRIMAALDLAEARRIPLEWYALSSGARIAMDSGTENMDWIAAVLRRLIEFTQRGGEVNVVVTGINVGAQPYWNAEATMLMHTRGVLIMTPSSAMVLTGKASLDYSGGVSAEDNTGIGGFERVMGPNGQGQYWAPNLADACALLLRHYDLTYVVPGEPGPRRTATTDPTDRDIRTAVHRRIEDSDFTAVGDVFSDEKNPDRKKAFDMRSVMRSVADTDTEPLERWGRWRDAETAIVWDARIGGIPVCLLGIESRPLPRSRFVPADGPPSWTSGTLFPQSSRKLARAINAASSNRPLVVLANLSGFDGSPESMRNWQLEYGAEIGRAVTNFRGPIVFVVVSRYHGGAFVVFSKQLNEGMEIAAVEGSYASVIGGAPAAAVVFSRDVAKRTDADPRVVDARQRLGDAPADEQAALRRALTELVTVVRAQKLKEVADEFDAIHDIRRAQRVGSVDLIVPAREIRPYVVGALERGLERAAQQERLVRAPAR